MVWCGFDTVLGGCQICVALVWCGVGVVSVCFDVILVWFWVGGLGVVLEMGL